MTNETAPAAPAMTVADMADRIVREDVLLCVSVLVSDLQNVIANLDLSAARNLSFSDEDLLQLSYRAADADDYVEQAPERITLLQVESEGNRWEWMGPNSDVVYTDDGGEYFDSALEAAQSAYEANGWSDPDGREIYEHWAVSSFLADALEKRGETVVRDFAGMTVWGRPTTGQSITMDHVIQEIARDILAA